MILFSLMQLTYFNLLIAVFMHDKKSSLRLTVLVPAKCPRSYADAAPLTLRARAVLSGIYFLSRSAAERDENMGL
jgi:predicted amidohydrolase